MAKKSQRRQIRYEKDKAGCMWGFISMFDFRHGHPTRKLIADKRRSSKHAVGVVHSKNKFEMLSNMDEDGQGCSDSGQSKRPTVRAASTKPSVKKLIEEEMFIDQNAMKEKDKAQVESKESRLRREVFLKLDSKRNKKSCEKDRDITRDSNLDETLKSQISNRQHSRKQSKDNLDLEKIIEEFCHLKGVCSMVHGNNKGVEVHSESNHMHDISENNARAAIIELVNQMINNGKDLEEARKFLCSHELMEALQLISSDKELLNTLILKCIQEFGNSQGENDKECSYLAGSNFSEQDHGNLEQTRDIVNHKKHNFFRKKVKSQSKSSTNENGNTDFPNRIVVLKPGNHLSSSLDSHDTVEYDGPSVKGSSHFSLSEIKKKLKHAMGKERHGNLEGVSNKGLRTKAMAKNNVGMRSPNKDHFFIEKIARPTTGVMKGDKTVANKDSELIVENEKGFYPKQGVSNLYIEAKKHLYEMVGNGDKSIDSSSRQSSKSLGRILSLPEYNFSPFGSPGRDWEQHFVTAQTRFSTSDKIREASKDNLSPEQATFGGGMDQETGNAENLASICDESSSNKVQDIKSDSNFSDELSHVNKEENYCHVRDEIVAEESVKEINVLESSSEPVGNIALKEEQNYDVSEVPDSARCSKCLKQDVTEENQPLSPQSSPSHSSITKKIKELECVADVSGRPSPVSVLDTPFLEDDVKPGCSRFQTVEVPVPPLHIQFEEQDSSPVNQTDRAKYCFEENELIYDYIKAVMQASGLTKDQLLMKCLSSDKILDPSLFDQVESLPNQFCHDPKLLYDCINDILTEVCCHYFGASPCVSFVSPGIRPTPNMKRVNLKVWEGVCWLLLPLPPPHTLDKIVRKDMEKTGAWMDLRFEAETVGFEMGDDILDDLMEDAVLSCVSKSDESECSQLQFEFNDNKSSTNMQKTTDH